MFEQSRRWWQRHEISDYGYIEENKDKLQKTHANANTNKRKIQARTKYDDVLSQALNILEYQLAPSSGSRGEEGHIFRQYLRQQQCDWIIRNCMERYTRGLWY